MPANSGPGNPIDWREAYLDNLPKVYNYLRFRVGDGAVAEDLTSSTFEKAWRGRHRYRRDRSAFSTWLLSIASNVAIDHFRKAGREIRLSSLDEHGSMPSAEQAAERMDQSRRLLALLTELPPRERELFAMKHGADLTNRQIAALTGLSESNVGTILYRVARQLRSKLDGKA